MWNVIYMYMTQKIWWLGSSNAVTLGNAEHSIIATIMTFAQNKTTKNLITYQTSKTNREPGDTRWEREREEEKKHTSVTSI